MNSKITRRSFLAASASLATAPLMAKPALPRGKAEHCIFLWLGGGMGQIDTFDPKTKGDPKGKKAGSMYTATGTAVKGLQVCEHLSRTAKVLDRATIVRTVNHRVIDEHAFATNLVHTGRMISGNVTYPSIGSLIVHQKGPAEPEVPAYLLMGYPNVSRGPGFLGAKHGYVYLTDTSAGPSGFTRPVDVDAERSGDRNMLLGVIAPPPDAALAEYREAQAEALRLAGPGFLKHFDLTKEPKSLRENYGGEFGQRCLLARRLVEAGVRFVEVSHNLNFLNGTGWDIHNEGGAKQHLLIQELDAAFSTLVADLESKKLLDKTLIVIATEFGRPPEFDGRGGRGHQGTVFSMVLAGGGLKHCGAFGVTDELSKKALENPVSIPDFHATIHAAMGIDPAKDVYDGARPVPITDGGTPITELFA